MYSLKVEKVSLFTCILATMIWTQGTKAKVVDLQFYSRGVGNFYAPVAYYRGLIRAI
jgi:hypothetical protein